MKKLLTSLTLGLALTAGVTEARAEFLTNWTYDLSDIKFTNANTDFVDSSTGSIKFNSGNYNIDLTPGAGDAGDLAFSGPGSSASTPNDSKLVNQTTATGNNSETSATKLADLSFSYLVTSVENPSQFMNVTYTIPLYTFYDATLQTAYVYYNNSEVSTSGATAITYDGVKYGVTGIGLFVDGRELVSFPGGENDPNLYSGWAINLDTMGNHYDSYVVGGDSNVSTGLKTGDFYGQYSITGIFSIANSEIDTPAPTPEPATMLLTGLGLAGLGAIKRRRNKVQ